MNPRPPYRYRGRKSTAARIILAAALLSLVAAANQTLAPPSTVQAAGNARPSAVAIASDIINFTLANLTINVGDTVTWTNRDGPPHTTTSGQNGAWDGVGWNSAFLSTNQSFSNTFNTSGSFPYTCRVHSSMNATVTVEPFAPSGLTAVDSPNDQGGAVDLSWTPSTSGGVTEQRLYRGSASGAADTLFQTFTDNATNSFTDAGLTNGVPQFYVVLTCVVD